jgi:photosystem II stability/assembly factor-like uncharacterized protein
MKRFIHYIVLVVALSSSVSADGAPPAQWISRGPGGGGAFFGPAISPHNPSELFVSSDMGDTFHSANEGLSWETLDFRQVLGQSSLYPLQFTSDPNVLYTLNGSTPVRSADGGKTWLSLPGDPTYGGAYSLLADVNSTNRVLVSDYGTLYFSNDGGATFNARYTTNDFFIAGAFFDGLRIFVGTRPGLLVSTNGGVSFALSAIPGIPSNEGLVSFAGAKSGGTTRLFGVTLGSGDVYPGVGSSDYSLYHSIYRLDYGVSSSWTPVTNGISGVYPFFISMATNNIQTAYVAGGSDADAPMVALTTNGGASWQQVFLTDNNANIATGWQGDDPGSWNWLKWTYGEFAEGFSVCPSMPNLAIISDLGFMHMTTNGGLTWSAIYTYPTDLNATNSPTDKLKSYHGIGLENTSCWNLEWATNDIAFASFTDMRGILTTNGGASWLFPTGLTYNSTYQAIRHPTNGFLYAAASSVHDLYAWDRYLTDSAIDGGNGAVIYSTNSGKGWQVLHDFTKPVYGLCVDPVHPSRLYACVVNSSVGGIYVTTNLGAGAASTWGRLAVPPRTRGHPYRIRVLNDGTLACSYSGGLSGSPQNFGAVSGVFVSTNGGVSWLDRTATNMQYYVKDLVLDPNDASQRVWYAGVWGEWGNSSGKGGLYRTKDRGVSWTCITTNIQSVESCTFNPSNSNELYLTTETQGLWYSANANASLPNFMSLTNYSFAFSTHMVFNPFDSNELWVGSYGNGLRLGRLAEPEPGFVNIVSTGGNIRADLLAESGQTVVIRASTNLFQWQDIATNIPLDGPFSIIDTHAAGFVTRFYRAVVLP